MKTLPGKLALTTSSTETFPARRAAETRLSPKYANLFFAALALFLGTTVARADSPRLFNLSARGAVGTGNNIMVAGLVVGQGAPETVLIRAIGPGLALFGARFVLAAPVLTLFDAKGVVIQSNQGWNTGNATAAIMASAGAFTLTAGSLDSALVVTLPAGAYTAQIAGAGGTTGNALLEVYEIGATASTARLINLSARGQVGTLPNVMIPGITVSPGTGNRTLLIRAAGPTLASFGVSGALLDTYLTVFDSTGAPIASNDNWGTPIGTGATAAALSADFTAAGAFPFTPGGFDSALVVTLPPGSYTALATGSGTFTGVALVEVYDITPAGP